MSTEKPTVEAFVKAVRQRLNRFGLARAFFFAALIVGILLTLAALAWIIPGYAVPKNLYLVGAALLVLLTLGGAWLRRQSETSAARFADRHFSLKDTLSSALRLREKGEGSELVTLQSRSAERSVAELEVEAIPFSWPRRMIGGAALLLLISGLLAFKPASPAIQEKLETEAETIAKSGEINDFLEELLEEIEEDLTEDERDEFDPDSLRDALAELKQTEDQKEAMRQYAQLERQLREAAQRLDQRRDEQLMARVGEELQKDAANRELGQKLSQKQFREAGAEAAAMKRAANAATEKLDEQRKQLARLKAASQRMAAAAEAASRQGATSESNPEGAASESDLASQLSQLQQSVSKLDDSLKRAQQEQKMNGQVSKKTAGECQSCRSSMNQKLDQLNQSLCKMGAKRDAQQKLLSMCQSLGQCQGYLGEKKFSSLSQCMSAGKGGKSAGQGSTESRQDPAFGEPLMAGEMTSLMGQKGDGPSTTTTEAASSGDGVSSRRVANQKVEFQKQMEAFVKREDVPEEVKDGVKDYFMRIHQSTTEN